MLILKVGSASLLQWQNTRVNILRSRQGILQGDITVPLTSCLTGLDQSVLQIKTKIVSCHTADSKPVKEEVNGTMVPFSVLQSRVQVELDSRRGRGGGRKWRLKSYIKWNQILTIQFGYIGYKLTCFVKNCSFKICPRFLKRQYQTH